MDPQRHPYALKDPSEVLTPALLIYPDLVAANIEATLKLTGNDPNRWRPHIKTAKIPAVIRQMIDRGVRQFKCSTTLELLTACELGAEDVLLAFPVTGANANRTLAIARHFPNAKVSVLIESGQQASIWQGTGIGVFIDINPGMDRTGIGEEHAADIRDLALQLASTFRGLHYYDGHVTGQADAHSGYDRLLEIVETLARAGIAPAEVITSGTPAAPFALTHAGLRNGRFIHRISPGTVVYNDMTSLKQLPGLGYIPAAVVLATVVSHPTPNRFTCDAGHKSVSADAGVPTCEVAGRPDLKPMKPSEEHLPIDSSAADQLPAIGSHVYLIPRHVCPTVNNFDEALMVVNGEIRGVERVAARGHEGPLLAPLLTGVG
jgi:D-serine deaminase-like pyridoxal phosphate-dependent protein